MPKMARATSFFDIREVSPLRRADANEKGGRSSCGRPFSPQKRPGKIRAFFNWKDALVAAATAITTVTATALATVSTATTAAATSTTAAITTTTAAATTAFTRFHGARFVDRQGAAVDFLAVELRDRRLGFLSGAHFDETEATRTSRHAIVDHLHPRDVARLGK
jgi:hypothetical protein